MEKRYYVCPLGLNRDGQLMTTTQFRATTNLSIFFTCSSFGALMFPLLSHLIRLRVLLESSWNSLRFLWRALLSKQNFQTMRTRFQSPMMECVEWLTTTWASRATGGSSPSSSSSSTCSSSRCRPSVTWPLSWASSPSTASTLSTSTSASGCGSCLPSSRWLTAE